MLDRARLRTKAIATTGLCRAGLVACRVACAIELPVPFRTEAPGVRLSKRMRDKYPEEMTIVLQYQFFGLKLEDDCIHVTLSFNNVKENLVVPIDAITTFADPSVNFALQFQNSSEDTEGDDEPDPKSDKPEDKEKDEKRGEVISLDKFRKK